MIYITQNIGYGWKKVVKDVLPKLSYGDQSGFFESAIATQPKTQFCTYTEVCQELVTIKEDEPVVVNIKCANFVSTAARDQELKTLLESICGPTAILIPSAEAETMLPDAVLDAVNVIFKREPFKDRSRYDISEANRAKIVPTMISCPFVHAPRDNWLSKAYHLVRPKVAPYQPGEEKYDVGFSGYDSSHHSLRRDVWKQIVDKDFSRIGGLQPNPYTKKPIPETLRGPRFKGRAYRDALCQARINLALDGIGQYTFRHQELLYLGKFILSSPTIRELELPMPLEEGKHYVAFDDMDDMVEKIHYYLVHEDERNKIAAAGQALFQEYYNPERHGQEILAALERVKNV